MRGQLRGDLGQCRQSRPAAAAHRTAVPRLLRRPKAEGCVAQVRHRHLGKKGLTPKHDTKTVKKRILYFSENLVDGRITNAQMVCAFFCAYVASRWGFYLFLLCFCKQKGSLRHQWWPKAFFRFTIKKKRVGDGQHDSKRKKKSLWFHAAPAWLSGQMAMLYARRDQSDRGLSWGCILSSFFSFKKAHADSFMKLENKT